MLSWRVTIAGLSLGIVALLASAGSLILRGQDSAPKADSPKTVATSDQPRATADNKTAPSPDNSQIKVLVKVVNVPVTVLDKRGMPVIDLKKEDFQVFEDGKAQTIRYFRRDPRPPLRIGLILDTSNSARRQLSFQQDAASEFVFNLLEGRNNRNQIYLQTYDATSSVIQDFTNDPEILNEKIRGLKAGGGKALYDAIYFACREKMLNAGPPEETRRVLVVISDGNDVQSEHSLEEAVSMAHRAETLIYCIGNSAYGYSNPGDKTLDQISEDTGGAALFPLEKSPGTDLLTGYLSHGQVGDEGSQNKGLGAETGKFSAQRLMQLADSLDAINRELDEQYSIGYTSTNTKLDGTFRNIRVVAMRKGVQVRSKVGYFATNN